MCGICGIVKKSPEPLGEKLRSMNDAQAHRGPDGEGYYVAGKETRLQPVYGRELEEPAVCGLGHRRLAIIDPALGRKYPFKYKPTSIEWGPPGSTINVPGEILPAEKTGFVQEIPGHGKDVVGNVYDKWFYLCR